MNGNLGLIFVILDVLNCKGCEKGNTLQNNYSLGTFKEKNEFRLIFEFFLKFFH